MPQQEAPGFWDMYTIYLKAVVDDMSPRNPFFAVLVLGVIFLVAESISKKMLSYSVITRKGFLTDLFYLFLYDFLLLFPFLFLFEMTIKPALLGEGFVLVDLSHWPTWLLIIVLFILVDFLNWFGHVLLHKIPFLWKFHKIHHAQEELGFASTRHFHWVEYLVFRPLMFIPFSMFGVLPEEYIIFQIWVSFAFTFLSHANIKFNWGPIRYIFITPDTHYWHHAKNVKSKFSVNYASVLCVWDQLFGYFYLPKDEKRKTSIRFIR